MVILRANGTNVKGLGHLYRIFSIIELIKDQYNYLLLVSADSVKKIIPKDYNYAVVKSTHHEFELLKDLLNNGSNLMIADGYEFNYYYQKKVKNLGFNLIYIDDLTTEHMYADAVINHSAGIFKDDFSCETHTKLYLGPKYALLRKPFLIGESSGLDENSLFVCFGGADPKNILQNLLDMLADSCLFEKVNVVLGAAYKERDWLKHFKSSFSLYIHENLESTKMAKLISSSGFAITPSSTVLYEVCALNIPVLSGFFIENQERIYNGFLSEGLILGLGDLTKLKKDILLGKIQKIKKDKVLRNKIVKKQKEIFDGQSGKRILSIIENLL